MLACTIYLNGTMIGEHLGGYMSFFVDITNELVEGENNLIVYVDSRERKDIPPYGHLVDFLTFGGIYRDVHISIRKFDLYRKCVRKNYRMYWKSLIFIAMFD